MPNLKISQLTVGGPAQNADEIPINRSGVNYSITAAEVAALASAASSTGPRPFGHQWYYSPAISAVGISVGAASSASVSATASNPVHKLQSNSSANSSTTTITAVTLPPNQTTSPGTIFNLSILKDFQVNVWTPIIASRRLWVGMVPAYGIPSSGLTNNGILQHDDPVATAISFSLSAALTTGTGSAPAGNTEYDGTIPGGGSNAYAGVTFVVTGFTNSANNGTFLCTGSSTSFLILQNASGASESHAATAAATTPTQMAAFRYSTFAGDTTWQAYCSNGTSSTVADTGVTPSTTLGKTFEIQQNTPGVFAFYIDGSLKTTISTNTPSGTMTPVLGISSDNAGGGASLSTIGWGFAYVELNV